MAHALLSPSSAARWLVCTAAPRLEAQFPDSGSEYAAEGTLAHELCETLLRQEWQELDAADTLHRIKADPLYSHEMQEAAEDYVAFVSERLTEALKRTPDAQLFIEQKMDLTEYIPEGFGTVDALIIADGLCEVIDFKYGKGVAVAAERNPQMMTYALGALSHYDALYDIQRLRLTIIQPRIYNSNSWEISSADLRTWGDDTLLPKAQEAFSDEGRQQTGDHCRFCRAKGACRALADEAAALLDESRPPTLLSTGDLALHLPTFERIESFIAAARELALSRALGGERVPGFKLVEGRSLRKITDEMELSSRLIGAGYDEAMLFKPRSLETLTSLEKLIGKKQFAELSEGLISKPPGKPTLVPESDKRPEMVTHSDDFTAEK